MAACFCYFCCSKRTFKSVTRWHSTHTCHWHSSRSMYHPYLVGSVDPVNPATSYTILLTDRLMKSWRRLLSSLSGWIIHHIREDKDAIDMETKAMEFWTCQFESHTSWVSNIYLCSFAPPRLERKERRTQYIEMSSNYGFHRPWDSGYWLLAQNTYGTNSRSLRPVIHNRFSPGFRISIDRFAKNKACHCSRPGWVSTLR